MAFRGSVDFLAVGHLTADLSPDGARLPGGAVTYAALTAQALGLRVGVVTRAEVTFAHSDLLPGVDLHVVPAAVTTTFENRYDAAHRRSQRLLAQAPALAPEDIPDAWRRVPVVLFGAVIHELGPEVLAAVDSELAGLAPQGWLRHVGAGGQVRRGPWLGPPGLLAEAGAVFLSAEDLEGEPRGAAWFAAQSDLLVVTAGAAGASAWRGAQHWRQPALAAAVVDATGAGDAFAAAFCIRLAETGDVARALAFAAAVSAFAVEAAGPAGLPTRREALARAGVGG